MKKIFALGPAGTNGNEAAERIAASLRDYSNCGGKSHHIILCNTHAEVFGNVVAQNSYGVVPIENSSEGLVADAKRFWLQDPPQSPSLCVVAEVTLPIEHVLAVRKTANPKIEQVLSHPQALGQCRENLERFGLKKLKPTESTAGAGKLVAEDDAYAQCAALVSPFAAKTYDLRVLQRHMEDYVGNSTRFHVLGHIPCPPARDCRSAMFLWCKNRPMALAHVAWAVGLGGVNLSSFHSIPLGKAGIYAFYAEFDEHCETPEGRDVLKRLETVTERIVVLGSYPKEKTATTEEAA